MLADFLRSKDGTIIRLRIEAIERLADRRIRGFADLFVLLLVLCGFVQPESKSVSVLCARVFRGALVYCLLLSASSDAHHRNHQRRHRHGKPR